MIDRRWFTVLIWIALVAIALGTQIEPPIKEVTPPIKEVMPQSYYPLPEACAHLRREPDPDSWNPETDTYPRNHAWEKCMGVN